MSARGQRGFTLIEVVLATVLLAAGLALAFATITAAMRTTTRGEQLVAAHERQRSAEGFLRRRLAGARPVAFALDASSNLPQRFVGEPERLRFVADLPDYLGRGGPYLHDLALEDGRLVLRLAMVLGGEVVDEPAAARAEVLVDGLRAARLRYRALDRDGGLGPWLERWEASEQLPLLVELSLVDADGRAWPAIVVALPLAGVATGTGKFVQ